MPSIYDFPEELLEHIIVLCIPRSPLPITYPSWHTPCSSACARRTSPLLVSKLFNRIGTPLLYHTVNITNSAQAQLLLRTLQQNPSISPLIRCLILSTFTIHIARALALCSNIYLLDFTLGGESQPHRLSIPELQDNALGQDVVEFCNALPALRQLRHLVVRKANASVYLTTPRVKCILSRLADAVLNWNDLETTNFAFKFADDAPRSRDSTPDITPARLGGPIARLTRALSTRPKLHTFAAYLPSIWSDAILRVSTNKRLERIVLSDGRSDVCIIPEVAGVACSSPAGEQYQQNGVLGTGLFFMEAKKHAKLIELIRAGTYVDLSSTSILRPINNKFSAQTIYPLPCALYGGSCTPECIYMHEKCGLAYSHFLRLGTIITRQYVKTSKEEKLYCLFINQLFTSRIEHV
ncbi:hypothetical protein APHAL10511_007976 [Amanita phalloides]|nr:hypothetical protein APHAL10511_007976 [Amanita phalloides]